MSEIPVIKIFATGGTIDKSIFSYEHLGYVVDDPQAIRILAQSNVGFVFDVESICKKDSLELTDQDRSLILERIKASAADKIIITHGTDTVTKTAQALKEIQDKTIILTGSMLPARFYDSDATFNLGGAVIAAQTLPHGVYLVMNGLVIDPFKVRKNTATSSYDLI